MGTVIVTGASRGIGAATAEALAQDGHVVYAASRRPERSDAGAARLRPLEMDVTAADSVARAVARVVEERGGVDALVNNAGVAWFAPGEEMSEHVLRTTMETNFFGAVRCTQAVLPIMRRQGRGEIVMISTLAAATGLPLESAYCASKSALEAFAESVRHEVARFGVGLWVIEPGITEGGLSTSTPDPEAPAVSAYRPLLDHTFAYYEAAQAELDSPALVAEAVGRVIDGRAEEFRVRLGTLGPVVDELVGLPDPQGRAMLEEALGIRWWREGEPAPTEGATAVVGAAS